MCAVPRDGVRHSAAGERRDSNMRMEQRLTAEALAGVLIRVMEACLRRLRTMKTVSASHRKMVMAVLSRMDVAGYRAAEKRSLMVEIHRECNRI